METKIVKKLRYGDDRRMWKDEFVVYMLKIVESDAFEGMPDAIDEKGQVRWNAPSNRPPGRWQDLRDRRLKWWRDKAKILGIETKGEWISKVAKAIHPFKEKPCQTCGRVMSLEYVYPTRNTIQKLNLVLPSREKLRYEDFLTIYEVIPILTKSLGKKSYQVLQDIFPVLSNTEKTEEKFISDLSKKVVPFSPRGKLSPGAMSNAPDRLDGFHTYNLCCRHKQDIGRSSDNLKTYSDDRRAFEFWCEGDWAAANLLMNLGTVGVCTECGRKGPVSADHVGPISLGFTHMPWFKALCSSCNSSKGNRLSLSDVQALIARENDECKVASFQITSLWNFCKKKIMSDSEALSLSKLLRINQHYYLLLLREVYNAGHPEMLLPLLSPELAQERIVFLGSDFSKFTFSEIVREKRADTYSKSKATRMIRIAFDALDDYASKEKRNIHEIPLELEESLRKNVLDAIAKDASGESVKDVNLSKALRRALKSSLGPEERTALLEKVLNGKYKPDGKFPYLNRALHAYVDEIGLYLARNKF